MPNARDLAAELLLQYDRKGDWVRLGLEHARAQLEDPRDRGLLTELAYGCVRRLGTMDAVLATASKRAIPKLSPVVRAALRLGLYQMLFLDRVPAHAAVDHAVGWVRAEAGERAGGYANGVLRNLGRDLAGRAIGAESPRRDVPRDDGSALRFGRDVFVDPAEDAAANLAQRYSMPAWIVERWRERWGDERCAAILRTGIGRPPLTVRARIDPQQLQVQLRTRDIAFETTGVETALRLPDGEAALRFMESTRAAAVQDATSQRVAPLLDVRPGMAVLDLCAAPGGKTLHIADLMQSGRLVACDIERGKVEQLETLRDQMGGVDYETVQVKQASAPPFERESFDAVLVDAPCTNTGVLRRRVEARWRLKPKAIEVLSTLQAGLLDRSVPLLAPGGRLVYSTCSLEPEENEDVYAAFLERHPSFSGEIAWRAWPSSEADGGFAAVFRRE